MIGRLTTIAKLNESLKNGIVVFTEQIQNSESGVLESKNTFLTANTSVIRAVCGQAMYSFTGSSNDAFDIVSQSVQTVVPELFCGYVHDLASIYESDITPVNGATLDFNENRFFYVFSTGEVLPAEFISENDGSYTFQYSLLGENYLVTVDIKGVPVDLVEDYTESEMTDSGSDDYWELKRFVIANSNKLLSQKQGFFVIGNNMEPLFVSQDNMEDLLIDTIVIKIESIGFFEASGQLRAIKLLV